MKTRQLELEEQSYKEAVAKRRRELQQAKKKDICLARLKDDHYLSTCFFLTQKP